MTNIEKHVDDLGRIVLPIGIRNKLGLSGESVVSIELCDESIIITPIKKICKLCGKTDNIDEILKICQRCISIIKEL